MICGTSISNITAKVADLCLWDILVNWHYRGGENKKYVNSWLKNSAGKREAKTVFRQVT